MWASEKGMRKIRAPWTLNLAVSRWSHARFYAGPLLSPLQLYLRKENVEVLKLFSYLAQQFPADEPQLFLSLTGASLG